MKQLPCQLLITELCMLMTMRSIQWKECHCYYAGKQHIGSNKPTWRNQDDILDLICCQLYCYNLLLTTIGGEVGHFLEDLKDFFPNKPHGTIPSSIIGCAYFFHSDFQNQTMRMQKFSKARCNVGTSADKKQELNT